MGFQTVMGEWAGVFGGASTSLHTSKRSGFLGGRNHEMVVATLAEQDNFSSPSLLTFPEKSRLA